MCREEQLENRMVLQDEESLDDFSEEELETQAHMAITDSDSFYHNVFLDLASDEGACFLAKFYELYQDTNLAKEMLEMVKEGIQQ